jgi:gluconokinase
MSAGKPLTDAMRAPWLDLIRQTITKASVHGGVVASCSSLKQIYRARLAAEGPVFFVHLALTPEATVSRMTQRSDHFMPSSLAYSQAQTLEPLMPFEQGLTLDATRPIAQIVMAVLQTFDRLA